MKWLPRSLSGQLIALWLLALVAAHVIAVVALTWWRADNATIHPLSIRTIETRVLSAYRVAERSADAEAVLKDISLPDTMFKLAIHPLAGFPETGEQEAAIAKRLRALLGISNDVPVYVRLERVGPGALEGGRPAHRNGLDHAFRSDHAWGLDIDVRLPNGQWLLSRSLPTMLPAHWSRVLSFSLLVGMLPTALIALLFGRRIMRPLRNLTEASKRVSRGEQVILPAPDGLSGIREITQAFNDMQASLTRFVNGRTQMVAAIGHDLRTPLTSLRIRAEFIDDEPLRDAMVQTLDEMSIMVEEILGFARDDALREPTQDVCFEELVREVVDQQTIQGRSVSFKSELASDVLYRCRPVHLKRGLGNIIDNATRFGEVRVKVRSDAVPGALRIEVDDSGPGIDPEHLEQVFEPFARLDAARSTETGGLGLGLAIARSCIRAHGGDVTLHNRETGGLRAVIELPV